MSNFYIVLSCFDVSRPFNLFVGKPALDVDHAGGKPGAARIKAWVGCDKPGSILFHLGDA